MRMITVRDEKKSKRRRGVMELSSFECIISVGEFVGL